MLSKYNNKNHSKWSLRSISLVW